MTFNNHDKNITITRYKKRYQEFGKDEKTLGWTKGKQKIRFEVLTSQWDLEGSTILDIGCGFGDLYEYLKKDKKIKNLTYVGIDIVDDLINEANNLFKDDSNTTFILGDFTQLYKDIQEKYNIDYIFISGTFNFKLYNQSNYNFVFTILENAFKIAKFGVASDFLSSNIDFKNDLNFHMNLGTLYEFSTTLTRNIILRHDYMPFEYSIFLNKDDSFLKNTIFNYYLEKKQ
jgi:SAM-dependent methyltransferase